MLSESASGQLALVSTTGTMNNPVYHYNISVTDTGTTNVGTFWFAWVPGEDFLPSSPTSESSPTGWGSALTGGGLYDGTAIQWVATTNPITPGHSLSGFAFTSPDSPAVLAGKSPSYPTTNVLTSFMYKAAPEPGNDPGFQFTVAAAPTSTAASATTLSPSQATINQGDSVTFTATVAPAAGSGATPTGSVEFLENGNPIGSTAVSDGSAALTTSMLPSGSLSITAQYSGDATYTTSTSSAVTETIVAPAPTTTTLTTSNASVQAGDSVTFTATVAPVTPTGSTPTGTVTFSQNGSRLATVPLQSDGTAQLVTTTLPVGADQITAVYSGSSIFTGSTSTATTESVNAGSAATTTALATSAVSIQGGDSVMLTATVAAVTAGGPTPTGTVNFVQDGNALGSEAVGSDGTAVLATTSLAVGSDTITATYSGDANYAASTSSSVAETVTTPAALVPAIAKSTVPAAIVAGSAARGAVSLVITNSTAAAIKGKFMVELFASMDGTIDGSAIEIGHAAHPLNVKTTATAKTSVPVKILPGVLPAGSYTLLARVIDPSGNNNDSATGGTLTVAAPFIALSETFTKMTIPSSVVAGAKVHDVAVLRITNNGNVITPATTSAAIYASLSGVVDTAAMQINGVTKPLRIHPGKTGTVMISIKQIPAIAAGTYTILGQVVDPNGQITDVTSGVVTITAS